MNEPLAGIRVLEMTTAIQGPAAALYLADMGAEVIKVEPPLGDGSRYHRGVNNTLPSETYGSQFIAVNRGKRSVSLDIHSQLGREVVERLLSECDVFVTNFRNRALERPPALGEAKAEIVARLGFSDADIAARAEELREAALAALSTQSS